MSHRWWALLLVGTFLLVSAACAPLADAPGSSSQQPPNIVLAVVDTLRADHLGAYGHPRPTSPAFDRLAADSVLFTQARAQAPCTFPSANSLLTSRPPWAFSGRPEGRLGIPPSIPTVASRLRRAGYRTAAVSASPVVRDSPSDLNREGGFGAGFDLFLEDCLWQDGSCVQRRVEGLLDLVAEPFFLYLHYLDPHDPYRAPPQARSFADPAPPDADPAVANGDPLPAARRLYAEGDAGLSPTELSHLRDRYDEEVSWADHQLGALDALLERRGLRERTLLVITADHGESFLEHGHLRHCRSLYDEELRVPLLVRPPQVGAPGPSDGHHAAHRVHHPVALLDLTPTLLDYAAGVENRNRSAREGKAGGGWAGQSLRKWIEAPPKETEVLATNTLRAATTASAGTRRALVVDRWKLIHDLDGGASLLYDVAADPRETHDLAPAEPETLSRLLALLDRRLRAEEGEGLTVTGDRLDRSRETDRQLRALGYLP